MNDNIGKKVIKLSGKPFKFMLKVNHPVLKGNTFNEDDSYVSIIMCQVVEDV